MRKRSFDFVSLRSGNTVRFAGWTQHFCPPLPDGCAVPAAKRGVAARITSGSLPCEAPSPTPPPPPAQATNASARSAQAPPRSCGPASVRLRRACIAYAPKAPVMSCTPLRRSRSLLETVAACVRHSVAATWQSARQSPWGEQASLKTRPATLPSALSPCRQTQTTTRPSV